ncbi:MAG: hypothetical protein O7H41_03430 [Planctomycetota bacterium]|nr:hypothetical protein [Planctomycetota bacterium]
MVEAFGFPDDQGKAGQLFTINLMLQLENSIEEMRAFPIPHPELKDAWLTARETQLPSADREKAFRDAHAQVQAMIVWFAVARKHTRGALCSVYKDMEPTVEDVNSAFVAYFLPLLTERLSWKKGKGGLVLRDHHRPIRDAILKWERDKSTRPQEPDHGEMEWEKIHQAEALDQPAPHEPEEGRTEWSPKWIAPMESASIPIGGNDDNLSMADSKEDDHEATVVDSVLAAEIVEVIREEFGEDGVIVYEGHFATSFPISRPELETLTGITVERQRSLERKIGVLLRHRLGSDLG